MNQKNKKNSVKLKTLGFTLIELLAVIVILAVIATITIPIVLSLIEESETSANKESLEMYGRAVKQSVLEYQLDSGYSIDGYYVANEDGTAITNLSNDKVNIKIRYEGNPVICKKIHITEDAEVYLDSCKINGDEFDYTYGSAYVEAPDLYEGTLTPVVYDGENWIIVTAVSKDWYNYQNQEWANAVLLRSDSNKKVGDVVTVDGANPDALAMFVWIPRYEYKIEGTYGKGGASTTSPGEIEVNFITVNQLEASEDYRIHPAFNFGGEEISGIWVGKFGISHATSSTKSLGCTNESCIEGNNLRTLPNVQTLTSNSVSSYFYAIRSMSMSNNIFGIDSNTADPHMIKTSEWGAVAYLTQSKYGKYGNNDYAGRNKEVYVNNSSGYYTGRSGGSYGGNTPLKNTYTDQTTSTLDNTFGYYTYDGYLLSYNSNTKTTTRDMKKVASTTGNITGIYDMSGASWDYVMGVYANENGVLWSGSSESANSGFSGKLGEAATEYIGLSWPNKKYYDTYSGSSQIYYGYALTETANFYEDVLYTINAGGPWFIRSGSLSASYSGIFTVNIGGGDGKNYISTRAVITKAT